MKRLLVVLLIVGCLHVVVAPASATTVLRGTWTGGVATYQDSTLATMPIYPSGNLVITIYPGSTVVASQMVAVGDQMPFPWKWNWQSYFGWDRAVWNGALHTYTIDGTIRAVPYVKAGLEFKAELVANTMEHTLFMRVDTKGSYWGWDHWDFYGMLQ
jgi:hypothetical protein